MKIKSKFKPAWWLPNPHLQTIWAAKVRKNRQPTTIEERLELPDGDFVDINWSPSFDQAVNPAAEQTMDSDIPTANDSSKSDRKVSEKDIVCIFHGLAGSIQSGYAGALFESLQEHHFDVVFMHFRGCSGEPNRKLNAYHSGHTDDIRHLIDLVTTRYPDRRIRAVGFSLGANALLKYLGECGDDCPLSSAVAVAPPLVLQAGANRLNKGLSRLYQRYLLKLMRQQVGEKQALYPDFDWPSNLDELDNFWKFDDAITAPIHGFTDVHDYYTRSSSRQYLPKIRCQAHIIYALDDPFFDTSVVPEDKELPDGVTFEASRHGGHVGFVTGPTPWKADYWLDSRVPEILIGQA